MYNYDEIIFINGIIEHTSFCARTIKHCTISLSIIYFNIILEVLLLYRNIFDNGQSLNWQDMVWNTSILYQVCLGKSVWTSLLSEKGLGWFPNLFLVTSLAVLDNLNLGG